MTGRGPLTHGRDCPQPPPIIRAWPTRHGDTVSWCPACCRTGISPRPTPTPVRFEYPHPDDLEEI